MIPCKDCISFAICNSNKKGISCSILYDYFIEGGVNITRQHRYGASYGPPQSDRLLKIESFFKKIYESVNTHGQTLIFTWKNKEIEL